MDEEYKLLQEFYKSTGGDLKAFDKVKGFMQILSEAESFSGKRKDSDSSSAKGYYHFLNASVPTAKNRIKNILKKKGVKSSKFKNILDKDIGEMTLDEQSVLVLGNMMESPSAPYNAWLKGKATDQELYYRGHHTSDPKAVSSQKKVFTNWNNAVGRLKENKLALGGGAGDIFSDMLNQGIPDIDFSSFLGSGNNPLLDGMMGAGATGIEGAKGSLMGGIDPLAIASTLLTSLLPGAKQYTANEAGIASTEYDFGADATRKGLRNQQKTQGTINSVVDGLSNVASVIPGAGIIANPIAGIVKGVTSLFNKPKEPTNLERTQEYMQLYKPELQARNKSKFSAVFGTDNIGAAGGRFGDSYLDIGPSQELNKGGTQTVAIGGTHESNPNNGITINTTNGVPNKAEEGEFIMDTEGGKLVFTNRF